MKSRSKELIGVFVLLAISLALFSILVIALVNRETATDEETTPTATLVQAPPTSTPTVLAIATITPSALAPRIPTFTAPSIATLDISTTELPTITTTPTNTLQPLFTPTKTKPPKPTPCPWWKFCWIKIPSLPTIPPLPKLTNFP